MSIIIFLFNKLYSREMDLFRIFSGSMVIYGSWHLYHGYKLGQKHKQERQEEEAKTERNNLFCEQVTKNPENYDKIDDKWINKHTNEYFDTKEYRWKPA